MISLGLWCLYTLLIPTARIIMSLRSNDSRTVYLTGDQVSEILEGTGPDWDNQYSIRGPMKAEDHLSQTGQSNRHWRKKTSTGAPATAFRTLVGNVLICPLLSLRIFHKKLLCHTNIFFKAKESRDLFSHRSFLVNFSHKVELHSQILETLIF